MKQGDGNPGVVRSTLEGDIKRVGSYVIVSELGQGSFGKVYKARHVGTDELFALKVIPVGKVSSSYLKKLMNSEVKIMQQVRHPNVVHLHEFMTSGTHYYMVLDYCDGGDLFRYVRSRPKKYVEENDSVEIFKQIMNGFLELRRNRVIHRDIKSENIFRKDRQWLIGDFGLAKMGEDTATSYVGSYEFMAPEMLRSGPRSKVNYSSKIDLWSIGCLFFEILFGDTPFHYKTTPQMLDDVKKRGGKNLVFPRAVSPNMQDLLKGLLEDDPERRLGWEAFFAHPVFETGKVLDPKDAPQINGITEMVENQNRVEKEFAENRKADFKELEKPEINLLEVAKPENKAVTEEYLIDDRGVQLNESLHEASLQYVHERNKLWWVGYVATKFQTFARDPELRALKENLVIGATLVSGKALAFYTKLLAQVCSDKNIFNLPESIFRPLLNSAPLSAFKEAIRADEPKLRKSYQSLLTAFAPQIQNIPIQLLEPSPENLGGFDERIDQLFSDMTAQMATLSKVYEDKVRLYLYILVLLKSTFGLDSYFPFTNPQTGNAKYDWVRFYKKVENGAVSDLKEMLTIK